MNDIKFDDDIKYMCSGYVGIKSLDDYERKVYILRDARKFIDAYVEDSDFKDFNFDERRDWRALQEEYGEFRSLMDIALVNLWKYLEREGATSYSYYEHDDKKTEHMLDIVHDKEDFQDPRISDNPENQQKEKDDVEIGFNALSDQDENNEQPAERPRRKIRIAKPE